jgi:hypothetical protein
MMRHRLESMQQHRANSPCFVNDLTSLVVSSLLVMALLVLVKLNNRLQLVLQAAAEAGIHVANAVSSATTSAGRALGCCTKRTIGQQSIR